MSMDNQSTNGIWDQSDRDDVGKARMAKKTLRDDLPQVESNDRKCLGRNEHEKLPLDYLECEGGSNPFFSRPVRNAHRVPTFVGASRESFRPGKLLPKQLATGDLLTN